MLQTKRLTTADIHLARRTFHLMAEVFEAEAATLSDGYLTKLLARPDFWALAAFDDEELVGGLTAHTLPMTNAEISELLIYDVAVRSDYQRQGVGRQLMAAVRASARNVGISTVFVPAENVDEPALDFYRALGGEPTAMTMFTFSDDDET